MDAECEGDVQVCITISSSIYTTRPLIIKRLLAKEVGLIPKAKPQFE